MPGLVFPDCLCSVVPVTKGIKGILPSLFTRSRAADFFIFPRVRSELAGLLLSQDSFKTSWGGGGPIHNQRQAHCCLLTGDRMLQKVRLHQQLLFQKITQNKRLLKKWITVKLFRLERLFLTTPHTYILIYKLSTVSCCWRESARHFYAVNHISRYFSTTTNNFGAFYQFISIAYFFV